MDEHKVRLCQCLCPQRHCIVAVAYTLAEMSDEQAIGDLTERLNRLLDSKAMNPWCGLCQAPRNKWHYEVGITRFASMEEAAPVLKASQSAQLATAEFLRRGRN